MKGLLSPARNGGEAISGSRPLMVIAPQSDVLHMLPHV